MKTFLCVDDGGLVVVKVYLKREGSPDLTAYKQELTKIRDALSGLSCPHVWPFQTWFESDNKAFILRQYIFSNLYERISTRPFLSFPEKKWIAFQLLYALGQAHEKGVHHGDIKCENVLVTSWNWIYLSDFACAYKPTYIPADNPADFSFYFDAGSRRRCYLAPERFIDKDCPVPQGGVTDAMDIFALGCVLAELYLEGKSLFDLSQLHAYRRNEYDPETVLKKVEDVRLRTLILHMIQLDPSKRLTAKEYLQQYLEQYKVSSLHQFYASLNRLDADERLALLASTDILSLVKSGEISSDSEQGESAVKEGMTVMVSLFCSLLRNTKSSSSKCICIRLLCKSGMYCDDERKLQHVVPYLLSMVNQGATIVRSMALSALIEILESVVALPESEEKIFSEYIFPSLALLCTDPEEMVKVQFATSLAKLIRIACRLLHIPMGYSDGKETRTATKQDAHADHLVALKKEVSRILIDLTTSGQTTSATIQATMQNFECFCNFFGVQETNNLLLPLFITFLNHSDWQVRRDFFQHLPLVSRFTIPKNGFNNVKVLEAFLIPCVEQAFIDPEPEVVASSLRCLCDIVASKSDGLPAYRLEKSTLLNLIEKCKPFLGYAPHAETQQQIVPIQVLVSCVKFVAACARCLSQVDIYVHMLPRLKDVSWKVECPNFRDEMCIFDCLNQQHIQAGKNSVGRLQGNPNLSTSRALSTRHRMQDSRLSPGIAIYSVAKSDFLSTPEHSIHSAVRTGALQNNSNLKKALHSTALETQRQSNENSNGLPGPSASISILNESSFFTGNRQGSHQLETDSPSVAHNLDKTQRNISEAVVDALSTGVSGHANPHTYTHTWQPQGVLISHLAEHKRAVNKLRVSDDNLFLISASDDGTCKIWDCRKLEKDISFKSRLTYSYQGGRILSCASMIHSKQSVASASSDGSVHLWNVEYVTRQGIPEKYTGITRIGNISGPDSDKSASESGGALCLTLCGEYILCYATENGTIHAYDQRQGKDAWQLDLNPSHGIVRSMFCEPNAETWLASASNFGVISLFDLRFLMCAKQWQHPLRKDLHSMIPFNDLIPNNESGSCRVLISAGEHETAVWNIFEGRCEQIFRNLSERSRTYRSNPISCSGSSSVKDRKLSGIEAETEVIDKHLRSQQLRDMHVLHSSQNIHAPNEPSYDESCGIGHRAILPLPNGGFLTAGSDKFMRFWHPHRFEYSYCMCGPHSKNNSNNNSGNPVDWIIKAPVYYTKKIYNGISTVEEASHGSVQEPQQVLHKEAKTSSALAGSNSCHEDSILDLALIDSHEKTILSCSRDGVIKGWK